MLSSAYMNWEFKLTNGESLSSDCWCWLALRRHSVRLGGSFEHIPLNLTYNMFGTPQSTSHVSSNHASRGPPFICVDGIWRTESNRLLGWLHRDTFCKPSLGTQTGSLTNTQPAKSDTKAALTSSLLAASRERRPGTIPLLSTGPPPGLLLITPANRGPETSCFITRHEADFFQLQ